VFPAVPPAFLLAILLILLATQVAYVIWPRRPNYLFRLGLSAMAFALGELGATLTLGSRLAVGDLHPAVDLVLLAGLQLAATRWAGKDDEAAPRQPGLGGRRSR
jgi:hypothetical protein